MFHDSAKNVSFQSLFESFQGVWVDDIVRQWGSNRRCSNRESTAGKNWWQVLHRLQLLTPSPFNQLHAMIKLQLWIYIWIYIYKQNEKPSGHRWCLAEGCSALGHDGVHWLNVCTSAHAVFGRGSNICGHCWASVSWATYTCLSPLNTVQCIWTWTESNTRFQAQKT